jgi:hypothetical protein
MTLRTGGRQLISNAERKMGREERPGSGTQLSQDFANSGTKELQNNVDFATILT